MKTQINSLTSGTRHQILNPKKDYSTIPSATSHVGHSGSNLEVVRDVWHRVTLENPEAITITIWGEELRLTANWSLSGKSCNYFASVTKEFLEKNTGLVAAKKEQPYISIQSANVIEIHNGKKSFRTICPSLIEIK